MISSSELHIGNKFLLGAEVCTVSELYEDEMRCPENGFLSYDQIEGIPLNEQWLLRAGCFTDDARTTVWTTQNHIVFNFNPDNHCGLITFGARHVHFYHVHTFQNIIALTGLELEFKTP